MDKETSEMERQVSTEIEVEGNRFWLSVLHKVQTTFDGLRRRSLDAVKFYKPKIERLVSTNQTKVEKRRVEVRGVINNTIDKRLSSQVILRLYPFVFGISVIIYSKYKDQVFASGFVNRSLPGICLPSNTLSWQTYKHTSHPVNIWFKELKKKPLQQKKADKTAADHKLESLNKENRGTLSAVTSPLNRVDFYNDFVLLDIDPRLERYQNQEYVGVVNAIKNRPRWARYFFEEQPLSIPQPLPTQQKPGKGFAELWEAEGTTCLVEQPLSTPQPLPTQQKLKKTFKWYQDGKVVVERSWEYQDGNLVVDLDKPLSRAEQFLREYQGKDIVVEDIWEPGPLSTAQQTPEEAEKGSEFFWFSKGKRKRRHHRSILKWGSSAVQPTRIRELRGLLHFVGEEPISFADSYVLWMLNSRKAEERVSKGKKELPSGVFSISDVTVVEQFDLDVRQSDPTPSLLNEAKASLKNIKQDVDPEDLGSIDKKQNRLFEKNWVQTKVDDLDELPFKLDLPLPETANDVYLRPPGAELEEREFKESLEEEGCKDALKRISERLDPLFLSVERGKINPVLKRKLDDYYFFDEIGTIDPLALQEKQDTVIVAIREQRSHVDAVIEEEEAYLRKELHDAFAALKEAERAYFRSCFDEEEADSKNLSHEKEEFSNKWFHYQTGLKHWFYNYGLKVPPYLEHLHLNPFHITQYLFDDESKRWHKALVDEAIPPIDVVAEKEIFDKLSTLKRKKEKEREKEPPAEKEGGYTKNDLLHTLGKLYSEPIDVISEKEIFDKLSTLKRKKEKEREKEPPAEKEGVYTKNDLLHTLGKLYREPPVDPIPLPKIDPETKAEVDTLYNRKEALRSVHKNQKAKNRSQAKAEAVLKKRGEIKGVLKAMAEAVERDWNYIKDLKAYLKDLDSNLESLAISKAEAEERALRKGESRLLRKRKGKTVGVGESIEKAVKALLKKRVSRPSFIETGTEGNEITDDWIDDLIRSLKKLRVALRTHLIKEARTMFKEEDYLVRVVKAMIPKSETVKEKEFIDKDRAFVKKARELKRQGRPENLRAAVAKALERGQGKGKDEKAKVAMAEALERDVAEVLEIGQVGQVKAEDRVKARSQSIIGPAEELSREELLRLETALDLCCGPHEGQLVMPGKDQDWTVRKRAAHLHPAVETRAMSGYHFPDMTSDQVFDLRNRALLQRWIRGLNRFSRTEQHTPLPIRIDLPPSFVPPSAPNLLTIQDSVDPELVGSKDKELLGMKRKRQTEEGWKEPEETTRIYLTDYEAVVPFSDQPLTGKQVNQKDGSYEFIKDAAITEKMPNLFSVDPVKERLTREDKPLPSSLPLSLEYSLDGIEYIYPEELPPPPKMDVRKMSKKERIQYARKMARLLGNLGQLGREVFGSVYQDMWGKIPKAKGLPTDRSEGFEEAKKQKEENKEKTEKREKVLAYTGPAVVLDGEWPTWDYSVAEEPDSDRKKKQMFWSDNPLKDNRYGFFARTEEIDQESSLNGVSGDDPEGWSDQLRKSPPVPSDAYKDKIDTIMWHTKQVKSLESAVSLEGVQSLPHRSKLVVPLLNEQEYFDFAKERYEDYLVRDKARTERILKRAKSREERKQERELDKQVARERLEVERERETPEEKREREAKEETERELERKARENETPEQTAEREEKERVQAEKERIKDEGGLVVKEEKEMVNYVPYRHTPVLNEGPRSQLLNNLDYRGVLNLYTLPPFNLLTRPEQADALANVKDHFHYPFNDGTMPLNDFQSGKSPSILSYKRELMVYKNRGPGSFTRPNPLAKLVLPYSKYVYYEHWERPQKLFPPAGLLARYCLITLALPPLYSFVVSNTERTMVDFLDSLKKYRLNTVRVKVKLGLEDHKESYRFLKRVKKRFSDVAGIERVLPRLGDVLLSLRAPIRPLDDRGVPKGLLLVGPPGTGKSLLVQALAGEAQVPIIVQSGGSLSTISILKQADHVEYLFEKARHNAPCILFIDEIDNFGESRGRLVPTLKDKYDVLDYYLGQQDEEINIDLLAAKEISSFTKATVPFASDSFVDDDDNVSYLPQQEKSLQARRAEKRGKHEQERSRAIRGVDPSEDVPEPLLQPSPKLLLEFLVRLDGMASREGVLVIGATNRPDVLDRALTRPGRFDRVLKMGLPKKEKRVDILKFYSQKLGYENISWNYVALRTEYFTAADLSTAMNESALQAVLNGSKHTLETVEKGIDAVTNYITPQDKIKDKAQIRALAYYQAGKAVCTRLLQSCPVQTPSQQANTSQPESFLLGTYELAGYVGDRFSKKNQGPVDLTYKVDPNFTLLAGQINTTVLHLQPKVPNKRQTAENKLIVSITGSRRSKAELERFLISLYAGKAAELVALGGRSKRGSFKDLVTVAGLAQTVKKQETTSVEVEPDSFPDNEVLDGLENQTTFGENKDQQPDLSYQLLESSLGVEDDLHLATRLAGYMVDEWSFYSNRVLYRRDPRLSNNLNEDQIGDRDLFRMLSHLVLAKKNINKVDWETTEGPNFTSRTKWQEDFIKEDIKGSKRELIPNYPWSRIYVDSPRQTELNIEWAIPDSYFHVTPEEAHFNLAFQSERGLEKPPLPWITRNDVEESETAPDQSETAPDRSETTAEESEGVLEQGEKIVDQDETASEESEKLLNEVLSRLSEVGCWLFNSLDELIIADEQSETTAEEGKEVFDQGERWWNQMESAFWGVGCAVREFIIKVADDESETAVDESEKVLDQGKRVFDQGEEIVDESETAADQSGKVAEENETAADESKEVFDQGEEIVDESETAADQSGKVAEENETAADEGKEVFDQGEGWWNEMESAFWGVGCAIRALIIKVADDESETAADEGEGVGDQSEGIGDEKSNENQDNSQSDPSKGDETGVKPQTKRKRLIRRRRIKRKRNVLYSENWLQGVDETKSPDKLSVKWNDLYRLDRDYIFQSLVSGGFDKATSILDDNREILDFFADYLVRFQVIRPATVFEIFDQFGYVFDDDQKD